MSRTSHKTSKRRSSSGLSTKKSKRKFEKNSKNDLLEEVDDEAESASSSKKKPIPDRQSSAKTNSNYVAPGISVGVDIKGQIAVCDGEPLYL